MMQVCREIEMLIILVLSIGLNLCHKITKMSIGDDEIKKELTFEQLTIILYINLCIFFLNKL